MATVYRGHDHRLGVDRAIKVLLPSYAEKQRVRARFEAEARTMAVLDHPSIVRVYDVGSNDETAWIVMELVEGGTLLDRIGAMGIPVEDCLRFTAKVLEALIVAHTHGVVHRDIKPHNILLNAEGNARITDFGIARSAGHSEESFTKTGTVMGTWAFMAPEQRVNAKGVDHTADIYGMGATLFAMATGQTPMDLFAADLDPEMLRNVPEALVPLIRRSTRYQREERYPHATTMLEEVQAAREHLGTLTEPIRTPPPQTRPAETAPARPLAEASSNITYVPEGLEPPAEVGGLGGPATDTPLPFRPPPDPEPVRGETAEAEQAQIASVPAPQGGRERTVVVLVLILLLIVGGTIRRALKESAPGAPKINQVQPEPDVVTPQALPPEVTPPAAPAAPAAEAQPEPERTPEPAPDLQPKPATEPEVAPEAPPEAPPEPEPEPEPEVDTPSATLPAAISHAPATVARMGGYLPIQVRLQNLRPIQIRTYDITVYYRPAGTAAYRRTKLTRDRSTWTGNVQISTEMEAGMEYFIKAKSSDLSSNLGPLNSGSNTKPHRVRVSSP